VADQGKIEIFGSEEIASRESAAIADATFADLIQENEALRASLADMRTRVEELERLADGDNVTPLPNRRRFIRELQRVAGEAVSEGNPAALLYIDLDGLKAINDRYGRVAGDAVLNQVAATLSGLIRAGDFAARVGGDEFALILAGLDHNSAIDTSERVARRIAATPFEIEGAQVQIKATIGTTSILAGDTIDGILHRADRNTYRAKSGE
jgi:diguanylate cyclase (GGDEF)-like protein